MLREERGQSTVELALVLPFLLCVLIGSVQFALVEHAGQVADTAAAEGARLAAGEGHSLTEGAERTRELLGAGLGQTGAAFRVTAADEGGTIVVVAAGGYRLFIPWVRDLVIPIEARAEVREEGVRDGS